MANQTARDHKPSPLLQFIVNFAIPIFILTRFSSESQLGPIKSMLLALAFPVAFEIYNIHKRKKLSMLSIVAICGIVVTGAISLLGLSEGWLAIRRSVPYLAVALAVIVSILIKRPLLNLLLKHVIDMERVDAAARKNQTLHTLNQHINRTGYIVSTLFFITSIASYALTRIVITNNAGTSKFNEEYARLRLLSIPLITLPLLIGFVATIMYLLAKAENLTGLQTEELLKKK